MMESRVIYDGAEAPTAVGLVLDRTSPTLPPLGACGSIDIVSLLIGDTQFITLGPARVRVVQSAVDDSWAKPRVKMGKDHLARNPMLDLHHRGPVVEFDDGEVWRHKGGLVYNGSFGMANVASARDAGRAWRHPGRPFDNDYAFDHRNLASRTHPGRPRCRIRGNG